MEFQNISIMEMLLHLEDRGGEIDYINIQEMKEERDEPWNTNEHIVEYFSSIERIVKGLKGAKPKGSITFCHLLMVLVIFYPFQMY